jgi:hypothetical protein
MRVPIYEEITLNQYDVMSCVDTLRKSKVGKGPTYVDLSRLDEKDAYIVFETIAEALKILRLSPLFPYPLYIITPHYFPELGLATLKSVQDLPKHFFNRVKRMNSKELDLVNKINTTAERVSNHPLEGRKKELRQAMKLQKTLYQTTRLQASFESMLEKLNTPKESEE